MSFVEQADIFGVVEKYIRDIVASLSKKTIMDSKFYSMSYLEALDNYGSDKPDLRFGMKFVELTDMFKKSGFSVFQNIANMENGCIKAIKLEGQTMSRKDIDELTQTAIQAGASGLAYIIYEAEGAR
jgi:aspartyl-tRNA synthetase